MGPASWFGDGVNIGLGSKNGLTLVLRSCFVILRQAGGFQPLAFGHGKRWNRTPFRRLNP